MKQQVLKALANPSHLFHVPYNLAVINFIAQFIVFVILFTVFCMVFSVNFTLKVLNPLYFLISVILVHLFLARFSKHDIQLGQILIAKITFLKNKIPRRLSA